MGGSEKLAVHHGFPESGTASARGSVSPMAMLKALPSVRVASFCEACDGSGRVRAAGTAILGACRGLFAFFVVRGGGAQWRAIAWAKSRAGRSCSPSRELVETVADAWPEEERRPSAASTETGPRIVLPGLSQRGDADGQRC